MGIIHHRNATPTMPPTPPALTPPPRAETLEITPAQAGQRIDNFLIKHIKGVPKTRLYRALRGGEVRVNGARKKPPYQLCAGDRLRIPPLRRSHSETPFIPDNLLATIPILLEDAHLLIVDKPAGLAAHGGSGIPYGLIEALRHLRPDLPTLELAHRLDRQTSGCLILAKTRPALLAIQTALSQPGSIHKRYTALLKGKWQGTTREVNLPLPRRGRGAGGDDADEHQDCGGRRSSGGSDGGRRGGGSEGGQRGSGDSDGGRRGSGGSNSGQRSVSEQPNAASAARPTTTNPTQTQSAHSIFTPCQTLPTATLVSIDLITGRMHQARAHAAAIGHPIAGDRLHGDLDFNRQARKAGLTRLFLHAETLKFRHPITNTQVRLHAQLPTALQQVLRNLTADEV